MVQRGASRSWAGDCSAEAERTASAGPAELNGLAPPAFHHHQPMLEKAAFNCRAIHFISAISARWRGDSSCECRIRSARASNARMRSSREKCFASASSGSFSFSAAISGIVYARRGRSFSTIRSRIKRERASRHTPQIEIRVVDDGAGRGRRLRRCSPRATVSGDFELQIAGR